MHLITICNKLANDGIIAINQTELAVQPVVPEMIDAVNCVFIFDNDVEKLEFYRENGPFSQLVKTATKNNFYVYSTLKQAYKFVGTPGRQHHVYAYNKYGKKSPILHFYVMTNEEKAKALDSNYVEKTAVNAKISKAEKQIGQKLNELRLSKVNRDRLLIQVIKVADTNLLPAPVVTSKTDYSITLDVNYEELLKNCPTVFYACIADITLSSL
jgi:hypothetical protein